MVLITTGFCEIVSGSSLPPKSPKNPLIPYSASPKSQGAIIMLILWTNKSRIFIRFLLFLAFLRMWFKGLKPKPPQWDFGTLMWWIHGSYCSCFFPNLIFFNAKTTVIITRKFCKNISSQLLRNGDFKEAFSNTKLPRLCKHYCLHLNKCKTVSPKCYKHRYWKPKCSNHQDQAHHVQTSANVPFNWTLKRISAGKQRGPVVATLDCIKGHLEGMAALHPCLSLSLCQGQQGGSEWRVYCGLGKILPVRASLLKKDDPVEALHLCFFLQRSSTGEAALHPRKLVSKIHKWQVKRLMQGHLRCRGSKRVLQNLLWSSGECCLQGYVETDFEASPRHSVETKEREVTSGPFTRNPVKDLQLLYKFKAWPATRTCLASKCHSFKMLCSCPGGGGAGDVTYLESEVPVWFYTFTSP